eukprot:COSAG06_NODE_5737_length_3300_cov_6.881287_2_plen_78_part_00
MKPMTSKQKATVDRLKKAGSSTSTSSVFEDDGRDWSKANPDDYKNAKSGKTTSLDLQLGDDKEAPEPEPEPEPESTG